MILVETSAIVAIALEEAGSERLVQQIRAADAPVMTVTNGFEAALSIGKVLGDYEVAEAAVPQLLNALGIRMVGIEADLYGEAMKAYRRFGKGTGHPARLNFGDCFSYAYATKHELQLLYKGDDFARTDIASAT